MAAVRVFANPWPDLLGAFVVHMAVPSPVMTRIVGVFGSSANFEVSAVCTASTSAGDHVPGSELQSKI